MKKIMLLSILQILSLASTRVSDNEVLGGIFTSKNLKEFTQDSFNYTEDLAVVSDRLNSEEEADLDARRGLEYSIQIHLETYLEKLHKNIKLNGQSFDSDMMKKMAKEISKEIIEENKHEIAKIGKAEDKFVVLLKISKSEAEKYAKNKYRERLKKVIERLNDIYHDLEM